MHLSTGVDSKLVLSLLTVGYPKLLIPKYTHSEKIIAYWATQHLFLNKIHYRDWLWGADSDSKSAILIPNLQSELLYHVRIFKISKWTKFGLCTVAYCDRLLQYKVGLLYNFLSQQMILCITPPPFSLNGGQIWNYLFIYLTIY